MESFSLCIHSASVLLPQPLYTVPFLARFCPCFCGFFHPHSGVVPGRQSGSLCRDELVPEHTSTTSAFLSTASASLYTHRMPTDCLSSPWNPVVESTAGVHAAVGLARWTSIPCASLIPILTIQPIALLSFHRHCCSRSELCFISLLLFLLSTLLSSHRVLRSEQ